MSGLSYGLYNGHWAKRFLSDSNAALSLPHAKLARPFSEPFPNCCVDLGQDPSC